MASPAIHSLRRLKRRKRKLRADEKAWAEYIRIGKLEPQG